MKLSKLVKALNQIKKESGDMEILFSSDPEGNSYNSLGDILSFDVNNGKALIFPSHEVEI